MKNKADYSKYECPYSHLEKECGHELKGPEGYQDVYSVWCSCGYRGPVFYLDPEKLKLKTKHECEFCVNADWTKLNCECGKSIEPVEKTSLADIETKHDKGIENN